METGDILKLVAAVTAAGGIGAGGGYFGGDDSAMLDALTSSHRAQADAFQSFLELAVEKNDGLNVELKECSRELLAEVRGN